MSATNASIVASRVRQQLAGIAADRPESADRMAEPEEIPVAFGNEFLRAAARVVGYAGKRIARASARRLPMFTSPEKQIGDDADQRQAADHHQPARPATPAPGSA